MEFPDSDIFYEGLVDEEKALACLLAAEVCFLYNVTTSEGKNVSVSVNVSDVMAWGCSDAENISCNGDWSEPSEIIDLYRLWKSNKKWGSTQWVCVKRNEQPQAPVKRKMIAEGAWNDNLEKLPENKYDAYCRKRMENKIKNDSK